MELVQPHPARAVAIPLTRIAAALATLAAIVAQYASSTAHPTFNPVNFFSYFTIQSNTLTTVVLLLGAWWLLAGRHREGWLDLVRGAIVVYMSTTGIVYALLLQDVTTQNAFNVPLSNGILHQVMPLLIVLDWLLVPPQGRIGWRRALSWLLFPAAWLAYTLARGASVGWYPYPFLNPGLQKGYGVVALYCLGIALFMGVMCVLVAIIGNLRRPRLIG